MRSDTDPAYMGRAPDGCVVAIVVDVPDTKKLVAREVARWVRDGLIIERGTVADACAAICLRRDHKHG